MTRRDPSGSGRTGRRAFLRRVAGGAAAGALGATAGCQRVRDLLPGGSDRPGYARWLHRPSVAEVVEDADRVASFRFGHTVPSVVFDNEWAFRDRRIEIFRESLDFPELGVRPGDVEWTTSLQALPEAADSVLLANVYRADYDREAVTDAFDEDTWTRTDHRGYTLLVRDGFAARGWAVGDDEFVRAEVPRGIEDGTRFEPALERAVGVGTGAADGYLDRSEDGETLVSALGEGFMIDGRSMPSDFAVDGVVAFGENRFEGDSGVGARFVAVFEDADAVDTGAVVNLEFLQQRYDGLSVERDGRTAVATGDYDPPEG